jgi:hypothetical protein
MIMDSESLGPSVKISAVSVCLAPLHRLAPEAALCTDSALPELRPTQRTLISSSRTLTYRSQTHYDE